MRIPEPVRNTPLGHRTPPPTESGSSGAMTDFRETFRLMTVRRLDRELMGTFTKQRSGRVLMWVLAFVALEVGDSFFCSLPSF